MQSNSPSVWSVDVLDSEEPLLDKEADVIDRNEEVNRLMSYFAENYTRRKVVDTLLSVVIALIMGLFIFLMFINWHLESHIQKLETNETQIECSQLKNPALFPACTHVSIITKAGEK